MHKTIQYKPGKSTLKRSCICEKCPFKAQTKAALNCHALKKHGGRFQCLKCEFFGIDQRNLVIHRRKNHPTLQKEIICSICTHISKGASNHKNHMASKHEDIQLSCDACDYKAKVTGVLKNHIERVHRGKRYNCKVCKFSSTTNAVLKAHISGIHEGKRFMCDQCEYKSIREESVRKHKQISHEGIRYPCDVEDCSYKGTQIGLLNRHKRVWHSDAPKLIYYCDMCDFSTTDKDALVNKHKKTHSIEIIKCNTCEYSTNQTRLMRRHKQKHHDKVVFPCTICDHLAKEKQMLQTHIESKHGKISLKCEDCKYQTTSRVYLKNHIRTAHKLVPTIQCDTCDYKAKENRNMRVHKEKHKDRSERKLLSCTEKGCFKTYTSPEGLKEHVLAIHKGGRIKCEKCETVCRTKVHLKTHIRSIHLGIKYICSICDRELSSNNKLFDHIKENHEGEKILKCNKCEFQTVQKYPMAELRRHKKIEHNIGDKSSCKYCDYKGPYNPLSEKHMGLHISCDSCDFVTCKGYQPKSELRAHRYEKHRNGFKCEYCEYVGLSESKIKKHNRKHSFSQCRKCNFTSFDKTLLQSHNRKEHNKAARKRLEKKLNLSISSIVNQEGRDQVSRFECIDVTCKREGDHYTGVTAEDRDKTSQEVVKEMLRVVLEVVAVLVKRR